VAYCRSIVLGVLEPVDIETLGPLHGRLDRNDRLVVVLQRDHPARVRIGGAGAHEVCHLLMESVDASDVLERRRDDLSDPQLPVPVGVLLSVSAA